MIAACASELRNHPHGPTAKGLRSILCGIFHQREKDRSKMNEDFKNQTELNIPKIHVII